MIKEYNNKSLVFGVPGMILQAGGLLHHLIIASIGTVLLIIGLGFYAKAKGYSVFFGLFGLLSWFGVMFLMILKDKNISLAEQETKKKMKLIEITLGIILGLAIVLIVLYSYTNSVNFHIVH